VHPLSVDPDASLGRLIEAFEEVLDLRLHLLIRHGLGRLVIMARWKWGKAKRELFDIITIEHRLLA
jgi:hypothetical protein